MTLIVARVTQRGVTLVADTLLTHNNLQKPNVTGEHHVLKLRLFESGICVGFAGNVNGGRVFRELEEDSSLENAIHLCRAHDECDFLIATAEPKLYKISNGQVREEVTAWIGDQSAFRAFREAEFAHRQMLETAVRHQSGLDENLADLEVYTNLHGAMQQILYEARTPTVGGFGIQVNTVTYGSERRLEYQTGVLAYMHSETIPAGVTHVLRSGSAAEGGYSIQTTHIAQPYRTVVLFIYQAPVGMIFSPDADGHLRLEVMKVADSLHFHLLLKERGIRWGPMHGMSRRHVAYDAQELANAGELDKALQMVERELSDAPDVTELREVAALILFKAQRFREALALLQKLSSDFPKSARIQGNLAATLLELGALEDAHRYATIALQLDQELPGPKVVLEAVRSLQP